MRSNLPTYLPTNTSTDGAIAQSLLRVKGLCKQYVRGGLWRKRVPVAAARCVDFEIPRGQTLALVGESGSGKSTVARCVTRLERPDSGQILIQGTDIAQLDSRDLFPFRPGIQMVFQDAVTSMNPRFSALEVIEEPLLIHSRGAQAGQRGQRGRNRQSRRDLARGLMVEVGLSPDWMNRSILHFSGGQRQRLALARALTLRPQLLVLDEALSGLDLSTQAQIANLLLDLQAAHSLTYLLISHDLALVARLADVIGVMSEGQTVEVGPTQQIISSPNHAATKKLLASAKAAASNLAAITGASA
jgi:ABC-type glutathione transport system ATPase component